jgi:CHASE2 domain-containing sensor protein
VALLAPTLALITAETRVGRTLERRAYDGWFTLRGELPRSSEVVQVAIDTDSEQSLGRYPWRRTWHASLIRNLTRAGASVIAFDATFADAFPADDSILRAAIEESGKVVLGAKTALLFQRGARGFRLEEPAGVLRGMPIGIVDIKSDPLDGVIREYPILHEYPQGIVPQLGVQAILRSRNLPPTALTQTSDGRLLR